MQLQKKNTYMRQEEQSAGEKAANQGMEETKPQGPEKDGVPARDQAAPAAQPAVPSAPSDAASLGALLRSAREARGLSLADAANALKLGEDALLAIEEGRYEFFPHKAYARGFLLSYAKFLKVESEACKPVLDLLSPTQEYDTPVYTPERAARPRRHRPWIGVLASLFMACLIGFAVWYFNLMDLVVRETSDEPQTVAPMPSSASPTLDRQMRELAPDVNIGIKAIPQLLTRRAEDFIWAANALADLGYDEVNLNLGCPAGTVVAKGKGSGFLREPAELQHFLDKIFAADLPIAISVKTRIGWASEEEFDLLADVYNQYPQMKSLTIHPRLRSDFYKGDVREEVLKSYFPILKMPVGYNGDVVTLDDISRVQNQFQPLAHIMVGRALMADPALFRKAKGGKAATLSEIQAYSDALLESYRVAFDNLKNALMRMKEYWFLQHNLFEGAEKAVKAIYKAKDLSQYIEATRFIYENCQLKSEAAFGWKKPLN